MKHTYKIALLSLCAFAQEMNAAGALARLRTKVTQNAAAFKALVGARAFSQTATTSSRLAQPTTTTAGRSAMLLATSSRSLPLMSFRTFSSGSGNNRQNMSKNWSLAILTPLLGWFGYETRTEKELLTIKQDKIIKNVILYVDDIVRVIETDHVIYLNDFKKQLKLFYKDYHSLTDTNTIGFFDLYCFLASILPKDRQEKYKLLLNKWADNEKKSDTLTITFK